MLVGVTRRRKRRVVRRDAFTPFDRLDIRAVPVQLVKGRPPLVLPQLIRGALTLGVLGAGPVDEAHGAIPRVLDPYHGALASVVDLGGVLDRHERYALIRWKDAPGQMLQPGLRDPFGLD